MKNFISYLLCMTICSIMAASAAPARFTDDFTTAKSKMDSSSNVVIVENQTKSGLYGGASDGVKIPVAKINSQIGYVIYEVDGVATGISIDMFYAIYSGQIVNSGYKVTISGSPDDKRYTAIDSKIFDDPKHTAYGNGGVAPGNQLLTIPINKSSKYRFVKITIMTDVKNPSGSPATAFLLDRVNIDYIAD
ncbi:MAG: hypothetical protein R3Y68_03425 [Rikenellaceae bacterium]